MKPPKTPDEFDYDLWTTEDGRCMVRVKCTGDVTEVSRDVMKALRAEEKRLRRAMAGSPASGLRDGEPHAVLSLDFVSCNDSKGMGSAWLEDPEDFTEKIITKILAEDFLQILTPREADVYRHCMRDGKSQQEYAFDSGLSISRVCKIAASIRKKAENFF